jgi:hypothetical protein
MANIFKLIEIISKLRLDDRDIYIDDVEFDIPDGENMLHLKIGRVYLKNVQFSADTEDTQ